MVDNYDKKAAEMSQKEISKALEKAREYFEKEKNFQERSNGDFSESTKRKKALIH